MPVIPIINEGIKMALKYTTAAPAPLVAGITTVSQVSMSVPALQFGVIPVIPAGAAASLVMTQLEALLYKSYELLSKLIQTLIEQYQKQYKKAVQDRASAEQVLYDDLLEAQVLLKEEVSQLEADITQLEADINNLKIEQQEQKIEYENTVFQYTENARSAELAGDLAARDEWLQKIAELDWWIADIVLMIVEIITKQLQLRSSNIDLEEKKPLSEVTIEKDWNTMTNLATDMAVAIPYRPDLPDVPSLPVLPPIPQIPELVKATSKAFAKWLTAPQVPPIGIAVSAIFAYLMSLVPSNTPATSAKMEAMADSFLLLLGGCV